METVEGNTNAGGSREGDVVAKKTRKYKFAVQNGLALEGFVYPKGIKPPVPLSKLRKGELVLANVIEVQRNLCFVDIIRSENRELARPYGGVIHIGEISSRYIDRLSDAFVPGDLIRARVIAGNTTPIFLSTASQDLGVLMAYCVKCGGKLQLEKGRLVCPLCRHSERRKIAKDYGQSTMNAIYPATSTK